MPRKILDRLHQLQEVRVHLGLRIETREFERLHTQVRETSTHQLAEPVERGERDAEHLAHVAHGRAHAVADDVCHHRCVPAAVAR